MRKAITTPSHLHRCSKYLAFCRLRTSQYYSKGKNAFKRVYSALRRVSSTKNKSFYSHRVFTFVNNLEKKYSEKISQKNPLNSTFYKFNDCLFL